MNGSRRRRERASTRRRIHPDRLPALEAELNALVYQAYGLDEDDIAVIEGSIGKTGVKLTIEDEPDTE